MLFYPEPAWGSEIQGTKYLILASDDIQCMTKAMHLPFCILQYSHVTTDCLQKIQWHWAKLVFIFCSNVNKSLFYQFFLWHGLIHGHTPQNDQNHQATTEHGDRCKGHSGKKEEKYGLWNMDVPLFSVNGMPLNTPDKNLHLLHPLSNAQ